MKQIILRRKRKPPTPRGIGDALPGFGFLTLYGSLVHGGFLTNCGSPPRDGAFVWHPQGGSR
jgi:hypothetical protein